MPLQYSSKNNPRVLVIQKLYGKFINNDEILIFKKHRFKKFIKDIDNGNEVLYVFGLFTAATITFAIS